MFHTGGILKNILAKNFDTCGTSQVGITLTKI